MLEAVSIPEVWRVDCETTGEVSLSSQNCQLTSDAQRCAGRQRWRTEVGEGGSQRATCCARP